MPPGTGSKDVPPGRWAPSHGMRTMLALHLAAVLAVIVRPGTWPVAVAALIASHLLFVTASLLPRSRLFGPNMTRLPRAAVLRGEVALSFDDGPDPAVTPQVLDLLDRYDAKASFFCVGNCAAAHPQLVQDIVRRGHSVENHSDRHSNFFAFKGYFGLRRELLRAQARLAALSGKSPTFFRAPMGIRSPLLEPALAFANLRYVSWTRRGYDAVRGDADGVLRRLTRGLAAGDILLLHDGHPAKTASGEPVVLVVLPRLLERIAALGLTVVSLPMAMAE